MINVLTDGMEIQLQWPAINVVILVTLVPMPLHVLLAAPRLIFEQSTGLNAVLFLDIMIMALTAQ